MKEKQIKRIAGLLSFLLAFAAFAGCGGGGSSLPSETESSADTSSDDADTESPADSSAEAPDESPWTEEPVVKSVFFSDFGNDESIGENWSLVNYGWGQNGVSYSNAGFTRSPGVVSKQGATGGIIVLNSYGNYYKDPSKRGQGACLISNRLFGPGLYEIRMKVVPRFGPCSTAWSYYTNSYARRANMIYTPDTKKAIKLCFEAHRNQTDKSGLPYVFHPFHVAEQMPDEETTIVALLHDVIEDTAYTIDDLRKMGFSEEVLDALDLMTHDKNVPYMEYVAKISENEIARTVKLADLRHNSDLTRLDEIDDKACNRIEKYKAAIRLLSESKTSFCPYYDKGTDTWRVDFPDRDSEEGDLLYVASEYARTGLYYPYNVAVTAGKEYSGHAHSFEGVIQALLDDPAGFSIAGFEEFYSKQEQEMLLDIRNKLMNNIGEKASTAAKPDSSELL